MRKSIVFILTLLSSQLCFAEFPKEIHLLVGGIKFEQTAPAILSLQGQVTGAQAIELALFCL